MEFIPPPLESGGLAVGDLLWPVEYSRSNNVPIWSQVCSILWILLPPYEQAQPSLPHGGRHMTHVPCHPSSSTPEAEVTIDVCREPAETRTRIQLSPAWTSNSCWKMWAKEMVVAHHLIFRGCYCSYIKITGRRDIMSIHRSLVSHSGLIPKQCAFPWRKKSLFFFLLSSPSLVCHAKLTQ